MTQHLGTSFLCLQPMTDSSFIKLILSLATVRNNIKKENATRGYIAKAFLSSENKAQKYFTKAIL